MSGFRWDTEPSGIATITLDRTPANALDPAVVASFHTALDAVEASGTRAVIIQSAGGPVFCAGADIRFVERCLDDGPQGRQRMIDFVRSIQVVYARLETLSMPTIAAIDGAATGGGFELVLACDIRIAGASVRIGLPEVNVGLIPGAGGTQRLTRLVGPGTAADLVLGAGLLTGEEAFARGLVQRIVDRASVRTSARDLALSLAVKSPAALASAKRCIALAESPEGYAAEVQFTADLLEEPTTVDRIRTFLAGRNSRSVAT